MEVPITVTKTLKKGTPQSFRAGSFPIGIVDFHYHEQGPRQVIFQLPYIVKKVNYDKYATAVGKKTRMASCFSESQAGIYAFLES